MLLQTFRKEMSLDSSTVTLEKRRWSQRNMLSVTIFSIFNLEFHTELYSQSNMKVCTFLNMQFSSSQKINQKACILCQEASKGYILTKWRSKSRKNPEHQGCLMERQMKSQDHDKEGIQISLIRQAYAHHCHCWLLPTDFLYSGNDFSCTFPLTFFHINYWLIDRSTFLKMETTFMHNSYPKLLRGSDWSWTSTKGQPCLAPSPDLGYFLHSLSPESAPSISNWNENPSSNSACRETHLRQTILTNKLLNILEVIAYLVW